MRDFEGSAAIATSADRLFNYLADVRHLPDYFPKALSAKTGDGDQLSIVLDLGGEAVELPAWFRADETRRLLQWGVPEAGYQGWMAITADPVGCALMVSVQKPVDDDAIDAEISDTIASIRTIMRRPA
jgi:hypothetical protein